MCRMGFCAYLKQHSTGVKWAGKGRERCEHPWQHFAANCLARRHHRISNTDKGPGASQQLPQHPRAGSCCFVAASIGLGNVDGGGERGVVGPITPPACIAAAAEVHGEVGVFHLGMRFWGASKAGAQLVSCFRRLQTAARGPTSNCLLILLRPGEQLPECPPSSCSISPGPALLGPPSTLPILPCTPGCAALP